LGNHLLEAALELDWQRTWGDAAKIKNLTTDVAEEYFLDLCQSYGKPLLMLLKIKPFGI
jgi:hypothetical protein